MKTDLKAFRYNRTLIAYTIVFGCFAFLFIVLYITVPAGNKDIVLLAAGYILAKLGTVVDYYFGTSKDKSDAEQSKIFPKDPPNP